MFLKILHFLFIAMEVVAIFNVLIIVHEIGHFLAARWRGLVIEEFGVWFGKPLWRKKINGVWYSLGSIPAGGFVKLPQLADMSTIEGDTDSPREKLPSITPLNKIIVAIAGPLFSMLLAFGMATIVFVVGKPESEFDKPVIGFVEKDGPADQAGLKVGDEVLEVDGKPVKRFVSGTNSIKWNIIGSEGEKIAFKVKRGGEILTILSGWKKEKTDSWRRPSLREVSIGPRFTPVVGMVTPKSPAAKAGLQTNDLVTAVNGTPIFSLLDLNPFIDENRGKNLELAITRHEQPMTLSLALPPKEADEKEPVDLGVDWGKITLERPSPWEQVSDSATTIFRMVGALTSRKSDVKAAHFSGPVGIMALYYRVFTGPEGWRLAISLSVLINVNLALINMLPFPVLDGGHISLALLESVRRKPVNPRILEFVQTACALLLMGFLLFVTVFDFTDFIPKKEKEPKPASGATPAPAK